MSTLLLDEFNLLGKDTHELANIRRQAEKELEQLKLCGVVNLPRVIVIVDES